MNIVIIGAGSMGCLYGVKLFQAGHEVTLVHRRTEAAAILQKNGLTIDRQGMREQFFLPVVVGTKDLPQPDGVIFFVKSNDTEDAAKEALPLCGPKTWVLTLQNGLGAAEILSQIFGIERVFAGTSSFGARLDGNILYDGGQGETNLGALSIAQEEQALKIASILNEGGLSAKTTANVGGLLWSKFLINVGINALTAILGCENGQLLQRPEWLKLMDKAVDEAYALAQKKGIQLLYENPYEKVRQVARATGANRSSMLQDMMRHKKTEIDFINGAVVRLCQEEGLLAPINLALMNLVKTMEKNTWFMHKTTTF